MAEAITAAGRCASYAKVSVESLIGSAVGRLSEAERHFCESRSYAGYACLVAAARARSFCNGELRVGDRRYRLSLCNDFAEVSSVLTSLDGR